MGDHFLATFLACSTPGTLASQAFQSQYFGKSAQSQSARALHSVSPHTGLIVQADD